MIFLLFIIYTELVLIFFNCKTHYIRFNEVLRNNISINKYFIYILLNKLQRRIFIRSYKQILEINLKYENLYFNSVDNNIFVSIFVYMVGNVEIV